MEPEVKAIELVDKFFNKDFENIWNTKTAQYEAKQCALITVEEVIKSYPTDPHNENSHCEVDEWNEDAVYFWKKVKESINKL